MKRRALGFILILLCFPIFSQTATISNINGKVEIQRYNTVAWVAATEGMKVNLSDTVSTGFNSSAVLNLDTSTVALKPLTRMTLDVLLQQEGTLNTSLYLRVGAVEAQVDSTTISQNFNILSPHSTASVRGTQFGYNGIKLDVIEGTVALGKKRARVIQPPSTSSTNGDYGEDDNGNNDGGSGDEAVLDDGTGDDGGDGDTGDDGTGDEEAGDEETADESGGDEEPVDDSTGEDESGGDAPADQETGNEEPFVDNGTGDQESATEQGAGDQAPVADQGSGDQGSTGGDAKPAQGSGSSSNSEIASAMGGFFDDTEALFVKQGETAEVKISYTNMIKAAESGNDPANDDEPADEPSNETGDEPADETDNNSSGTDNNIPEVVTPVVPTIPTVPEVPKPTTITIYWPDNIE